MSARTWVVLALCLSIKLLKAPGQANVLAVSTPAIITTLALDSASFGAVFAVATLTAAVVQPFFGMLLDRAGARTCIPAGILALSGGLALLSSARGTLVLYVVGCAHNLRHARRRLA